MTLRRKNAAAWLPGLLLALPMGCLLPAVAGAQTAPVHSYKVIAAFPHDPKAFTQGLEYRNGILYEGTGLNGRSSIREDDLVTGKVLKNVPLSTFYFGEGITIFGGHLYELTWKNGVAFEYDAKTFAQITSFHYSGEGWGLTHDTKRLIMSDGSSALRFLDPATFQEESRIVVRDGDRPVDDLNELEYINGEIWANVWTTDLIARIDPSTGHVNSWVDFAGLKEKAGGTDADVLNGIAYDARRKRVFVTGKLWPKLFEIRVEP
jgi:glutaminyl-peptide cyclotransferase